MSIADPVHGNAQTINFLAPLTIGAAVSATATTPVRLLHGARYLVAQATFLYGAGGTNATAYVQTSLDAGLSWIDLIAFQFTTSAGVKVASVTIDATTFAASAYVPLVPTDGTLTANTCVQGIIGDRFRLKYVTTGTYTGTTSLAVYGIVKG